MEDNSLFQASDDNETITFAVRLAQQAGALALAQFRKSVVIDTKEDMSPVTAVDRAVEQMIRQTVKKQLPDHGFFGEEYGSYNLSADDVWVVDPIDGTRSFITGWPIWGTLIAKMRYGKPHIGVIEVPATQERWVGVNNAYTTFKEPDGTVIRCKCSDCISLANARFYTTSILYFDLPDQALVQNVMSRTMLPRFGGDCYSYGLLASGHVDLVIEAQLEPYDFMALVPVVEGAGGVITDWSGNSLNLDSDGRILAAATAQLHAEALSFLRRS